MSFVTWNLRRLSRSKLLASLLLVAFAFNAGPRVGCVCADGHYELFCRRHEVGKGPTNCSCCQPRQSGCAGSVRCSQETDHDQGVESVVRSPDCCRPVVTVPSAAAKASQNESGRPDAEQLKPNGKVLATGREAFEQRVIQCAGPPPIDLVIALQRITI